MPQFLDTQCPNCQATMKLKSRKALGKQAPCPKCGESFIVAETTRQNDIDDFDTGETSSDYEYADDCGSAPGYEDDDRPRRRPARSRSRSKKKRRQSGGWIKPTLIGVGSLIVLVMIGGGVYLAMKLMGNDSAARTEALAYLPKDSEVVMVIRVSDVLSDASMKPFVDQLRRDPSGVKMIKQFGVDSIEDMETISVGLRNTSTAGPDFSLKNGDGAVVLRTKKPVKQSEMTSGATQKSHNGKLYYQVRNSPMSAFAGVRSGSAVVYFPDDRTVVFATEAIIQQIIDQGGDGDQRSDLEFADFNQSILFVHVPKSGSALPNEMRSKQRQSTSTPGRTDPFGGWANLANRDYRAIACGVSLGSGVTVKVQADCANSSEAAAAKRDLDDLLAMARRMTSGASMPGFFGGGRGSSNAPAISTLNSIKTSQSGTVVEAEMSIPQSLINQMNGARSRFLPTFPTPWGGGGQPPGGFRSPSRGR